MTNPKPTPSPPLFCAYADDGREGGGLLFASSAADHTLTHSLPREPLALKRALDCSFREKERGKGGRCNDNTRCKFKRPFNKARCPLSVFLEDVTG